MPVTAPRRGRLAGGGAIVLGYTVAGIAGSLLRHARLPNASGLLWTLAAGIVAAAAFGPLTLRLRLPATQRFLALFAVVYALSTISNAIEAVLFVRGVSPLLLLTGALLCAGVALPAAAWWRPSTGDATAGRLLRNAAAGRRWWSWTWRLTISATLWVPVYLGFAAADAPFMRSYYTRTGTTFTIPDERVIALAEVLRGLLHAVVLGVLAALLCVSRPRAWGWLTLALAAANGWIPLVQRTDWPYYVRFANAAEITGTAAVFAGLVVLLLSAPAAPTRDDGAQCAIIESDAAATSPPTPPAHRA